MRLCLGSRGLRTKPMNKTYDDRVAASAEYVRSKIRTQPKIGVILGSGLGDFGNLLVDKLTLDTHDIPQYPISSVEGHAGKILFGTITSGSRTSAELMVFQGRIHFYECNDARTVVFPIEIAHRLGVTTMIVTNAAGGVNPEFVPGDLMFINDYMNLSFENPLFGNGTDEIRVGGIPAPLPRLAEYRLDTALSRGIDGVILVGCKYGDDYQCHFTEGSESAQRRLENVKETLQRLQLPERLQLTQLAMDEWDKLPALFDTFVNRMGELGPNPYKGF